MTKTAELSKDKLRQTYTLFMKGGEIRPDQFQNQAALAEMMASYYITTAHEVCRDFTNVHKLPGVRNPAQAINPLRELNARDLKAVLLSGEDGIPLPKHQHFVSPLTGRTCDVLSLRDAFYPLAGYAALRVLDHPLHTVSTYLLNDDRNNFETLKAEWKEKAQPQDLSSPGARPKDLWRALNAALTGDWRDNLRPESVALKILGSRAREIAVS